MRTCREWAELMQGVPADFAVKRELYMRDRYNMWSHRTRVPLRRVDFSLCGCRDDHGPDMLFVDSYALRSSETTLTVRTKLQQSALSSLPAAFLGPNCIASNTTALRCLSAAVQEAWGLNMTDTAHKLQRFSALTSACLRQPYPSFMYAATVASLPATLRDLTLDVFTPLKARFQHLVQQMRDEVLPSTASAACPEAAGFYRGLPMAKSRVRRRRS